MPSSPHPSRRDFLKRALAPAAALPWALSVDRPSHAAPPTTRPVIDAHMHVWASDLQRYPYAHPYTTNYPGMPHAGTVEMLVDDMDRNGSTHCVLIQTVCHGWDNRYIVDCVRRFPTRFRGHGLIDPTDPKVADKLEYWTKEHGLVGMRFSAIYYVDGKNGGDGWLDAEHSRALWLRAEKLRSIFNFFISAKQLPRLAKLAAAHPQARFIVDHLAQIDLRAADPEPDIHLLLDIARQPNVWVKVSELSSVAKSRTYPFEDAYPFVKRVYEVFGPDRLLFGTGYPGTARAGYQRPPLADEIALIDKMPFFTPEDRTKVLGGNAARLWGFDVARN